MKLFRLSGQRGHGHISIPNCDQLCFFYHGIFSAEVLNNNNNNNNNNFPVSKEPAGLSRVDGKRPDGMTLIPWQTGKPVVWDVTVLTVICTSADSYVEASARESGAAAEIAAKRPSIPIYRYSNLPSNTNSH